MAITKRQGARGVTYRVTVDYPTNPLTGKRKQRSETYRTKKEAEAREREWLTEIERGTAVDTGKMTYAEYLAYWLDAYAKHNVRDTTFESYAAYARRYIIPGIGTVPLVKLTPAQLQGFYTASLHRKRADNRDGSISPRTVRYCHSIIRESLQHAFEMNMVSRNVADAAKPPRAVRPQITVWDANEAATFLKEAEGDVYSPLWHTALTTGMRQGELLGLRWQDVDLVRGVLHVRHSLALVQGKRTLHEPKTKSGRRTVSLSLSSITALRDHQTRQGFQRRKIETAGGIWQDLDGVFTTDNGGWIDASNLSRNFLRIIGRAKMKGIRFHDLRHTHATLLLQQGENVKVVSERLGHANISITLDTYAHVLPSMQQGAALRIDEALFGVA